MQPAEVGLKREHPARGPSMADVARHAGVSSQTVSRVSNSHSNVEAKTRERVLTSMKELGYLPNRAARALRSGRFHSIGVIMFTLATFGNMRTLEAIAEHLSRGDYGISLLPAAPPTAGGVSGAAERLREQAVDGIILVLESHLLEDAELSLPPGVPVVVITSNPELPYPVVDTDQHLGARQATQHLLGLGHGTVWHVGGPPSSFSAAQRAEAWAQTLTDAGIEPPPIRWGDWSTDSGYRIGRELARRDDVTAVYAANDQMALGVIRAMHELGRDVPGEVSVVGFDDLEESSAFWPPLTTVRQDFQEVGRIAVQLLLDAIEGRNSASIPAARVPTELIVRDSTAPPRPC
jgi:DNA-binding LacI/PurR family transcriptional regulator